MTEIGVTRSITLPVMPATGAVCPYLLAADGGWRASSPAREHRCTAVSPATVLAPEKQRRLCLVAEHQGCSTYAAASGVGGAGDQPLPNDRRGAGRPVARTAPLVLDHGSLAIPIASIRFDRRIGQGGLAGLMAVAFAAIVVARLSGGGPNLTPSQIAAGSSSTPAPSAVATEAIPGPAATTDGTPARTLVPTKAEPTPPPEPVATDPVGATAKPPTTATPRPPASAATYTVQSGDTLSGIASEFGTTWQVLADLNGLDDPTKLRVGQKLDLP